MSIQKDFDKWLRSQPHVLNIGFNKATGRYLLAEDETAWQAWQAAVAANREDKEILIKDASRYAWLRDNDFLHNWVNLHVCDQHRYAELTDAAIDRAMGIDSRLNDSPENP
jgi:hypothetical protein